MHRALLVMSALLPSALQCEPPVNEGLPLSQATVWKNEATLPPYMDVVNSPPCNGGKNESHEQEMEESETEISIEPAQMKYLPFYQ